MKAVVTLFLLICFVFSAHAEGTHPRGIALDGTLGTAGELNLQGPNYDIKATYGEQAGANLFHSFRKFNIHSDERATFNGPASVQNIIARVTGGNASWIDGKLSSAIPDANLYLMNSSGLMFGPNASLDLSGSFHATTADYLRLGEDGRFNAISHESDVLSTSEPSAFGFLPKEDRGFAPISFEGKYDRHEESGDKLVFSEGKKFSIISGDIEIKNEGIIVPDGRVDIASVASAGEVIPSASALDVSSEKMGNITISDGSIADVKGRGSFFIRAGAFLMSDSSIKAETTGTERGGVTDIQADTVSLTDGASISASSRGQRKGGDIMIHSNESVNLSGSNGAGDPSFIASRSESENADAGDAGDILIETKQLSFTDGAWMGSETFGSGKGGDVFVHVSESLYFSDNSNIGYANRIVSRTNAKNANAGDAGDIFIETKDLSFKDGGGISASTLGPGNGGSIMIEASGSVELTGVNPHGRNEYGFGSGIYALSQGTEADSGKAGNISLNADTFSLTDGAFINTSTLGGGNAGSIDISVNKSVYIAGDSSETEQKPPLLSQSEFQGAILPRADERFSISGIYSASANTESYAGDAGKITLTASDMTLSDGSSLTTEAKNAGGGKIAIRTENFLYLRKGGIATSVRGGDGNGGDIEIAPPSFVILNNSGIVADAYGGNGGNIHIAADQFIQSAYSRVSASSKLGIDGAVTIDAPSTDVSSGLTVLSGSFLNAAQWMNVPCSQRTGEKTSRFVITGRDGVSAFFDDWQPSPLMEINRSKADDSEREDVVGSQ